MKFVLEVDMGENAFDGNAVGEMGRILRYWAGNLKHFEMKPGDGAVIRDSEYREVGEWRITGAEPNGGAGGAGKPTGSPAEPAEG